MQMPLPLHVLVLQHIHADTGQIKQTVKSGILMVAARGIPVVRVQCIAMNTVWGLVLGNLDVVRTSLVVLARETKQAVNPKMTLMGGVVLGQIIHEIVVLLMNLLVQALWDVLLVTTTVPTILMLDETEQLVQV